MHTDAIQNIVDLGDGKVRGLSPTSFVLDHDSGAEKVLDAQISLSILISLVCLVGVCDPDPGVFDTRTDAWFAGLGFAAVAFFFAFIRGSLSDHYVVDLLNKELYLHRDWRGRSGPKKRVGPLERLHTLALKPSRHSSKHRVWWEYALCLIDRRGRTIEVVGGFQDYSKVCRLGEGLASMLAVSFSKGDPELYLRVERGPAGPVISYEPHQTVHRALFYVTSMVALFLAALLFFLWWNT